MYAGIFRNRHVGLGDIGRYNESWSAIEVQLNRKLAAFGQPMFAALRRSSPRAWNALTWLLGPTWHATTSGPTVLAAVQAATGPVMFDVPDVADVLAVQGKIGLSQDSMLGREMWNVISEIYGTGTEWWREPFHHVRQLIMGEIQPETAPEPTPVVVAPTVPATPATPRTMDVVPGWTIPATPARPAVPGMQRLVEKARRIARSRQAGVTKTPGAPAAVVIEDDTGAATTVPTAEDEEEVVVRPPGGQVVVPARTAGVSGWGVIAVALGLLGIYLWRKKK